MAGNPPRGSKGLPPPTMYSVAALKDLMSNKRQITLNRIASITFQPHEALEKLARSCVMYKRQRYESSGDTATLSQLPQTGAASSTSNVPAPFEKPVPKGKRGARGDSHSEPNPAATNNAGVDPTQATAYRGVVRMTDGTFAVQATDKGSGTGHGFACAELAALEYDSQQRRALGDAAACNFPKHISAEDVMGGRLLAAGLVPASAIKAYQAFVAQHGTVQVSRPAGPAAALEALADYAAAAEGQLDSAAGSGAAASNADADVEGPASAHRLATTHSSGATAAQKRARAAAEKRKLKAVQEAASAADHGPRIKRKKERPPLVERPQAPEAPPVRRGLFSTTALPVPVTTASAPKEGPPLNQAVQANQPQQEQRVLAGSPALQTLLQLQPSLDPSTRAGVVNVLRQWGVQPQGATTFALLPVSAAQQPVQQPMDDFELLRHTLKTLLLLVERIAGVHIKPADPDATLPVSVLAREAGQNELYTLVPLMNQVQGVLEAVARAAAQPSERPAQAVVQPTVQTVSAVQAPQAVQRVQVALQPRVQAVSPLQAQVAQTLATFGQFLQPNLHPSGANN